MKNNVRLEPGLFQPFVKSFSNEYLFNCNTVFVTAPQTTVVVFQV